MNIPKHLTVPKSKGREINMGNGVPRLQFQLIDWRFDCQ